jgi:hypothetical protein
MQGVDPGASADSSPEAEAGQAQPMVVDQYGNPVDPETARQVLEQLERDRRGGEESTAGGRGRGRWKRW